MSTPNISLLAGLVGGYNQAKDSQLHQDLAGRASQRDQMLQYLGHLATAPNVPVEHQQWALQKASELAQHDITKKLPKVDLGELPPVMRQQPDQQSVTQQPGFQLKPPSPPSQIGQASNGTVNALGASGGAGIQMPSPPPGMIGPQEAPPPPGGTTASGAPMSVAGAPTAPTVNVPPGAAQTIINPRPPQQIAPGGAIHLTTPQEQAQTNIDTTQQSINQLQRQYPMKSREDLAYFAKNGDFPKPAKEDNKLTSVAPGNAVIDSEGKEVYRNTEAKPGSKSGFKYDKDTGGVVDLSHGGVMTPEEVAANPHAKSVLDQAAKVSENKQAQALAKEVRQQRFRVGMANMSHEYQAQMMDARQEALTAVNKAMAEKAPKVQELAASVRRDMEKVSTGPLAGRWQEAMTGGVGADNPDFMRLRNDAKLLQTALMQMHTGSRGSVQMMTHFKDMLDTGKQSSGNLHAALNSIEDYAQDVKEGGVAAKAAVAAASRGKSIQAPKPPSTSGAVPQSAAPAGGFNWNDHPKVSQ